MPQELDVKTSTLSTSPEEMDAIEEGGGKMGISVEAQQSGCSLAWTRALVKIRKPVSKGVVAMSDTAAKYPKATVIIEILLAFVMVGIGLATNFYVEVDGDILWTPTPSTVLSHGEWLRVESGFPAPPRWFLMTIHAEGQNVFSQPRNALERVFEALDAAVNSDGYDDVCKEATVAMPDENGDRTCSIASVARFYNFSIDSFNENDLSDEDLMNAISKTTYPDGTPVDEKQIFGTPKRDESGTLTSASTFLMSIAIPETDEAFDFEEILLENILNLQKKWKGDDSNIYRLDVFGERSFDDEFNRALIKDIPLVPLIFVVMSMFTCFFFFRRSWVFSRAMLGFGAVCSVLFSIIFGYGLMFTIGIPFTSMTQVVPFIMFGIGLDGAFIIWGEYQRTDKSKTVEERIHVAIQEVGVSIFVTTLTSVAAFSLGTTSSVPAVYWLCEYAAPTIAIDFIFQMTFFVALIVLDERRVAEKKRDCLTCFGAPSIDEEEVEPEGSLIDRFMVWFSDFLMKPIVKVAVLVIFFGIFGGLAYSASNLEQRFKFTDVLPSPSYVADFWNGYNKYTGGSGVAPYVNFRSVDQSDPVIQQQMEDYVNALVDMDEIKDQPEFFWLRDFKTFASSNASVAEAIRQLPEDQQQEFSAFANSTLTVAEVLGTMAFEQQMDVFLSIPIFNQLYSANIVRSEDGKVTASRTRVRMTEVSQESVVEQVEALEDLRVITEAQGPNQFQDPDDWSFFTFDELFYIWQFYTESPAELVLSTILGVSAVSIISMIFIPHWSAIIFVAPIISILYVDLLGFLHLCGIAVNAVSYISLVMSIGLMVDFLLHILLRFFESKELTREAKVKDVLRTMGTSILVGGISTFLGVLPLVFSTSEIFTTIFFCFLGLVVLGVTHGLIFLPVVLSLFGPNVILELS